MTSNPLGDQGHGQTSPIISRAEGELTLEAIAAESGLSAGSCLIRMQRTISVPYISLIRSPASARVAALILALYLGFSGLLKLLYPSSTILAMTDHGIVPSTYRVPILMLHSDISIILSALLMKNAIRSSTHRYVAVLTFIFLLVSVAYLVLVIARIGWYGNCGCWPGILGSSNLLTPLLIDISFCALTYTLFCYHNNTISPDIRGSQ